MIDTSEFAFPKPGHLAGRQVLNGYRYSQLKGERWRRQGRSCASCFRPLDTPKDGPLHHLNGRGIGGGKRDDRDTELLCGNCHAKEHR